MISLATNIRVDNIPSELKKLSQWVLWKYGDREGKRTKVPHQVNGAYAKVNDRKTWTEFDNAIRAVETDEYDGIGFVFTDEDPYVGLDFDRCVLDDGNIRINIREILNRLNSYTEISPSGKGLHCIVNADAVVRRRSDICEIYGSGQYFTVTGRRYADTPSTIERRHEIVETLLADMGLIDRIRSSTQSDWFQSLFRGEIPNYPSQSEADLALCGILSRWTDKDKDQIDRIFRMSGLMRNKWNEIHHSNGDTYGEGTIAVEIQNGRSFTGNGIASNEPNVIQSAAKKESPDDPIPFWEKVNGNFKIKQAALIDYLHVHGITKIYTPGSQSSIFVHVDGHVLEEYSVERIKDHLLRSIQSVPNSELVREALIKGSNVYLSRQRFEFVPELEPNFHKDTPDEAFFYYNNGFVRVTKKGIELLPYSQLTGHIWEASVLTRSFTLMADFLNGPFSCEFGRFLMNAMGNHSDRLKSLCSCLGFLLHNYKDRSYTKAICFVDEAISDVPSGRAGKSLASSAIGYIVPSARIDGRNFQFNNRFAFQDVKPGTAVVEFNDVPRKFPFPNLFSVITDDMQIERKNRDRFTLLFSESPKFIISTNYVLDGEGGSHRDRIFEVEFSDYYNEKHKPVDDFGHRFFFDWDEEEWNLFDNFMMYCVQLCLANGLIPYRHKNLQKRKLRENTSAEFAEYLSTNPSPIEINKKHDKKKAYEAFLKDYPELAGTVFQLKFTRWVKLYAQIMDMTIDETKSGSTRYFTLSRRA